MENRLCKRNGTEREGEQGIRIPRSDGRDSWMSIMDSPYLFTLTIADDRQECS
jgi:hypothetical protein